MIQDANGLHVKLKAGCLNIGIIKRLKAIKKRYFEQQGDNPVVKHPTLPDTYRWLTLSEVKIIMGLDESYDLGETKTVAGEALGQGALINVFKKIIDSLKEIKN